MPIYEGKRWDQRVTSFVESPEKIEKFLDAYEKLCREHNISFSHEDEHGSFIIENFRQTNIEWARDASIDRSYED